MGRRPSHRLQPSLNVHPFWIIEMYSYPVPLEDLDAPEIKKATPLEAIGLSGRTMPVAAKHLTRMKPAGFILGYRSMT